MKLLLLALAILLTSCCHAQSPINNIFTKYKKNKGVSVTVYETDPLPPISEKTPVTFSTKTLEVENDDSKRQQRVIKKILANCNQVFKRRKYVLVGRNNDDGMIHKVYKYTKPGITEICELEQERAHLILTVTTFKSTNIDEVFNVDFKNYSEVQPSAKSKIHKQF